MIGADKSWFTKTRVFSKLDIKDSASLSDTF